MSDVQKGVKWSDCSTKRLHEAETIVALWRSMCGLWHGKCDRWQDEEEALVALRAPHVNKPVHVNAERENT